MASGVEFMDLINAVSSGLVVRKYACIVQLYALSTYSDKAQLNVAGAFYGRLLIVYTFDIVLLMLSVSGFEGLKAACSSMR